MIVAQNIYPYLGDPRGTQWKSLSAVVKWGSECDRVVIIEDHDLVILKIPNLDGTVEIIKYYDIEP